MSILITVNLHFKDLSKINIKEICKEITCVCVIFTSDEQKDLGTKIYV